MTAANVYKLLKENCNSSTNTDARTFPGKHSNICQMLSRNWPRHIYYLHETNQKLEELQFLLLLLLPMENWFSFSSSAVSRWLNIPGTGNERQVFWKADKFQSILRLAESRKGLVSHVSVQLDIFMPMIFVTPVIYVFFSGSIICLLDSNSEPHTMRIY